MNETIQPYLREITPRLDSGLFSRFNFYLFDNEITFSSLNSSKMFIYWNLVICITCWWPWDHMVEIPEKMGTGSSSGFWQCWQVAIFSCKFLRIWPDIGMDPPNKANNCGFNCFWEPEQDNQFCHLKTLFSPVLPNSQTHYFIGELNLGVIPGISRGWQRCTTGNLEKWNMKTWSLVTMFNCFYLIFKCQTAIV